MTILVTGANGHLGKLVVEALLAKKTSQKIAVTTREPEKASELAARGVEVRFGDFDDPSSLKKAFSGVERLLIISTGGDNETRIRQHSTAVQAAQDAGVEFIAYTSIANASKSSLGLAEVHRATEAAILKTGIAHSFLRNNWYLENEMGFIQSAQAGAPIVTSAGKGKVGWALRSEFALAAANVLSQKAPAKSIYELSGPLATYEDLGASLTKVLGKPVTVQLVDDDAYAKGLAANGLPSYVVDFIVGAAQSIRSGALAVESNDFAEVLGRPVKTLSESLKELIA